MRICFLCLLLAAAAAPQYIPAGAHLNRSSRNVEDVEWDKAKRTRDVMAIQSFVSRFPKGRHVRAAERLLVKLESGERSRSADDGPAYTLVPESKHVVRAVRDEQKRK